ncbi:MAG: hypothetical protein ACXW1Z_20150 [Methylobacter sp.]
MLYQRNWDKQRVINLFYVIDWLMKLPAALEQQLWHEIEAIEEKEKMQYVSSIEKIGIAKGLQEGLQQGLQQGVPAGEAKLLKKLLECRFGALPAWVSDKLADAGEQDLERWGEAVLSALTLDAVFSDNAPH